LKKIDQVDQVMFLRRLAETSGDAVIRVIGQLEDEHKCGKVLLWVTGQDWNVWFVGYYLEKIDDVETRIYKAKRVDPKDLATFKFDPAVVEAAVKVAVAEVEAKRVIAKALQEIAATESRLIEAEDRFRNHDQHAKAAGCARARAELMPIRDILKDSTSKVHQSNDNNPE